MVSNIMELLNKERMKELMIEDWGISQSDLEDVFMRIVETPQNNVDAI